MLSQMTRTVSPGKNADRKTVKGVDEMDKEYRICTKCIMDTTDKEIEFDENGVCNHCKRYNGMAAAQLLPADAAERELKHIVTRIREQSSGSPYDCVIGLSGGVDSTFIAWHVVTLGLTPLAIHVDNGWDPPASVRNIQRTVERLRIELRNVILDWDEFKDIQLAFLQASVPDAEIPTDHALAAILYRVAAEEGLRYIISGANLVTEGIKPRSWTYGILDCRYIKDVHRRFGARKLRKFPRLLLRRYLYYAFVKKIRVIPLLNYVPYNRAEAIRVLQKEIGWVPYGDKHCESIYTRFVQCYILPRKFNIDKRRAHLSTLICSGQLSRDEALQQMEREPYPEESLLESDRQYVLEKLGLSEDDFAELMQKGPRTHQDYRTSKSLQNAILQAGRVARRLGLLPKNLRFGL